MIPFIKLRWLWYTVSGSLIVLSIIGVLVRGVPYGIDFSGGAMMELRYTKEVPSSDSIKAITDRLNISSANIQRTETGYILRMPEINDQTHMQLLAELRSAIGQKGNAPQVNVQNAPGAEGIKLDVAGTTVNGQEANSQADVDANQVIELRFDTVGPVVGKELKTRSVQALILVLLAIMAYIAFAFRKVSWPVKSWKYGAAAVLALFHDVIITIGVYVWVASFTGWEVDTVFIAALLTILGYSVNDTIVVFDRIRENLPRMSGQFDDVVNASVNQTLGRSINTSMTTILVMLAIFIFGGSTLRPFTFALVIGIGLGTYSSIFIASPILVTWNRLTQRQK